ncbi:lipid A biosynthesis acyltransferase [Wenjunlia vitaminophila]|uniref:Lipid A biosynthesis acyltransferase n=1 Tax=Wenjunlia vitaminophila TaxID=76728 RepID=A0A0T6LW55_WENVI|nr:phosphatidylinositol mannoside acyltransferase [Wenjunlia vitaminophila]KRV50347.1 lipid A biosynthesis acyltransferase [Wenjunlia vitaminophila]
MRERLTDTAYALGWTAVKRMPESAAERLFTRIADNVWSRRGRSVLRLEANLRRVVPAAPPSAISELSQAGMRSYMRYWRESFRLPTWDSERVRASFDPKDVHRVDEGMASGQGVILALPHLANWDLAGAWIAERGYPFTTVAERLRPEKLFDRFVAYRESLGMEVLAHTGGQGPFDTMVRRLRAGRLVCLVADRDLSRSGVEVRFFGEAARMPAGPALLALQTGALLLPVTLWYGDILHGQVHPPVPVPAHGTRTEKVAAMTQSMADVFAQGIAEHPEDWHMLQRLWLADLDRSADGGRR